MIRVERGEAPGPVREPEFQAAKAEYEAFRSAGGTRVTQTKLDPRSSLDAVADMASGYIFELFRFKCAYTEVRAKDGRFHLHSPESDAYDERLGISANHYWWTAMWYRNSYLARRTQRP